MERFDLSRLMEDGFFGCNNNISLTSIQGQTAKILLLSIFPRVVFAHHDVDSTMRVLLVSI